MSKKKLGCGLLLLLIFVCISWLGLSLLIRNYQFSLLEKQFERSRPELTVTASESSVFPEKVGSFTRQTVNISPQTNETWSADTKYDTGIALIAWKNMDAGAERVALALPGLCGEGEETHHPTTTSNHFSYSTCSTGSFGGIKYYAIWTNNDWVINVEGDSLDKLIEFISNYPY